VNVFVCCYLLQSFLVFACGVVKLLAKKSGCLFLETQNLVFDFGLVRENSNLVITKKESLLLMTDGASFLLAQLHTTYLDPAKILQ
jgi:hypothetical protein